MIPIVRADGAAEWELLASLRRRSGEVDRKVTAAVTEIVDAVRERGDEAVREYTIQFDGRCPEAFEVSRDEINDALTLAEPEFVNAMLAAMENIAAFHNRQKQQSFMTRRKTASSWGSGCAGSPASGSTCRAARRPTPRRCS